MLNSIFDSLKSLVMRGPEPEPAPVAAVVPEPEQAVIPVAEPAPVPSTVTIPDLSGLSSAGPAAAAPVQSEPAVEEVSFVPDDYGENPERPVIEAEELDDQNQPPRSRQRIEFLLRTYEAGNMALTERRIASDKARYVSRNWSKFTKPKPVSRKGNPQANLVDPSVPVPTKTVWG
jgi:hypothetical protein